MMSKEEIKDLIYRVENEFNKERGVILCLIKRN